MEPNKLSQPAAQRRDALESGPAPCAQRTPRHTGAQHEVLPPSAEAKPRPAGPRCVEADLFTGKQNSCCGEPSDPPTTPGHLLRRRILVEVDAVCVARDDHLVPRLLLRVPAGGLVVIAETLEALYSDLGDVGNAEVGVEQRLARGCMGVGAATTAALWGGVPVPLWELGMGPAHVCVEFSHPCAGDSQRTPPSSDSDSTHLRKSLAAA